MIFWVPLFSHTRWGHFVPFNNLPTITSGFSIEHNVVLARDPFQKAASVINLPVATHIYIIYCIWLDEVARVNPYQSS